MGLDISNSDNIQNAFTAYLTIALNHNYSLFMRKRNVQMREIALFDEIEDESLTADDLITNLSILDQIENILLTRSLVKVPQQTRDILFLKIFDEMTFPQIATRLGLKKEKVAAIYYRAIEKIKLSLMGDTI